ncbi:MAG: PilN domain-containing protein [Myxococcota bacterium]
MIRINLLPTREGRGKRQSGKRMLALLGLVVLIECFAFFLWWQSIEGDVAIEQKKAGDAKARVEKLEKQKAKLEERETAKLELARQNVIFEKLKHEKSGPAEMLKFLSYVLTAKEDNLYNRDELKAQEAAGWSSGWDPDRLWVTELIETNGELSIKGQAKSHEDVAEFYRRLESGIYFPVIDPEVQQVISDTEFKEIELVSFEAYSLLNYNPDGELKMRRDEVPEALLDAVAAPAAPPAEEKKDAKSKKPAGEGEK